MKRIAGSAIVAASVAALVFGTTAGARTTMAHPKLFGSVGKNDGFVITLKRPNGKLVKTIPAGTYTFVIHDFSSIHGFDLSGPHAFSHLLTSVPFVGTKTTTLRLKAGKYKYFCPAHPTSMFAFFKVK